MMKTWDNQKWHDHLNSNWIKEKFNTVSTRNGLQTLYLRLIENKELNETLSPSNYFLSDLFNEPISLSLPLVPANSKNDIRAQIDALLDAQMKLARNFCLETTLMHVLRKRLIVLHRIFHAYMVKFNVRDKTWNKPPKNCDKSSKITTNKKNLVGSNALLELFIKTGLTLIFSLIRQNWSQTTGENVGFQVFNTALGIVQSLAPLSLADEIQLSSTALEGLHEMSEYLKEVCLSTDGACTEIKNLSAELLLYVFLQRGSLRYLLDWIDTGLKCPEEVTISNLTFIQIISQIDKTVNCDCEKFLDIDINSCDDRISVNEVAFLLMKIVSKLSKSYANSWINSDVPNVLSYSAKRVQDNCEVYVWGSNSSHQLAEDVQEKILIPKLAKNLTHVEQAEAGQYCTFFINTNGTISACGKGSYGRLGLGDSNNHITPKIIDLPANIVKISSSKGSDGHTLALTDDGHVYSWGDGDYGKLGHGNCLTQKQPKLILGPLANKRVVCINAGYRHSAAVTDDGELYTWGEGNYGRLGHGDSNAQYVPTLVRDVTGVGSVSCGSAHTLALSRDGKTVWSFGNGDGGKLGHGDTMRVYKPRPIKALHGMIIKKVCAGHQFSLALTLSGRVFSWGTGAALGFGTTEGTVLVPTHLEELEQYIIIDISVGDSHCLALSLDCEVFAWGNNVMGQCGQGNFNSPVKTPVKVINLEGVPVHQISAGTSHSIVWTAVPSNRQDVSLRRPFCFDLHQSTFKTMRDFLERYGKTFEDENFSCFNSKHEHEQFITLCVELLMSHLILTTSGLSSNVALNDVSGINTRQLLIQLLDKNISVETENVVRDCLINGTWYFLPYIIECMELMLSLLNQNTPLTKGQKVLLDITINTLSECSQISSLIITEESEETKLDECNEDEIDKTRKNEIFTLIENLINTLLHNLSGQQMEALSQLENVYRNDVYENKDEYKNFFTSFLSNKLYNLLSCFQVHLLTYCCEYKDSDTKSMCISMLKRHITILLSESSKIINKSEQILEQFPNYMTDITKFLFHSIAGSMLSNILHSVLLMKEDVILTSSSLLMNLLLPLDKFNKKLLVSVTEPTHYDPYVWVIDCEQICSFLLGICIYNRIQENLVNHEVSKCEYWLKSNLFHESLKKIVCSTQLKQVMESVDDAEKFCVNLDTVEDSSGSVCNFFKFNILKNLSDHVRATLELVLMLDEEIQFRTGISSDLNAVPNLFKQLKNYASSKKSFDYSDYRAKLQIISRIFFLNLIKAVGYSYSEFSSCPRMLTEDVLSTVVDFSKKMVTFYNSERTKNSDGKEDNAESLLNETDDTRFEDIYKIIRGETLNRCIFLMILLEHYPNNGIRNCINSEYAAKCGEIIKDFLSYFDLQPSANFKEYLKSKPRNIIEAAYAYQNLAETRLEALNQMLEFFSISPNECERTSLLDCAYSAFLCSMYGGSQNECTLRHYLDGIEFASEKMQSELETAVFKIHNRFVTGLKEKSQEETPENNLLSTLQLFALSYRFAKNETQAVVSEGLLDILIGICCTTQLSAISYEKPSYLSKAAANSLYILSISCSLHSEEYVAEFLDNVITALHSYFQFLLKSLNQEENTGFHGRDIRHPSSEKPNIIKIIEKTIGDFLGSLMLFVSVKKAASHLLTEMWIKALLEVLHVNEEGVLRIDSLRSKILAIKLLVTILPQDDYYGMNKSSYVHIYDSQYKQQMVVDMFYQLYSYMWLVPEKIEQKYAIFKEKELDKKLTSFITEGAKEEDIDFRSDEDSYFPIHDVGFDSKKCCNCTIENNSIVQNIKGGRGYALGNIGFTQDRAVYLHVEYFLIIGNTIYKFRVKLLGFANDTLIASGVEELKHLIEAGQKAGLIGQDTFD